MAISDKLNYLIETKQLFKDRLNSLGAEITSSTTFRNYLTWLDTFYGNASDKTDMSVNGVVGRTSQATAILPTGYTQVDYIESSGTQYIDTGINADTNLRVVLDMAYLTPTSANQNIGAIRLQSGNTKRYHLLIGDRDGTKKFLFYYSDSNIAIGDADANRHLFDFNVPIGKITTDNVEYNISTPIADVALNFYLFGRNSTSTIYMSKIKQWACKMYYNNELVRDFIPCYRNSDNEVGLYDLVNNVFYTNQGTGTFAYGSAVSIPNPDYPQQINNLTGNVPYKITTQNGEQTFNIPLGDIELCDIDTYEDKIYSSNGRFYLEKKIDKKFKNSFTAIIAMTSTLANNLYGYACNTQGVSSYSELGAIISNIFAPKILGSQTDTTNPNNVRFNMGIAKHTNTSQVVITIDKKYLETGTTTEFSNFLNNNNFEYYCVLATPTTTEITQENYPSLYNALKQIQDYLTAYKINKEFILGYSSPEIEY